jgi:phosphosulfolactate phosphohydrolase-like enzyme
MEEQLLLAEALVRSLKEENAALIVQSDKQITTMTAEAIVWVSNAQQEIKVLQRELKRLTAEKDLAIAARDGGSCKYCIDMTQCK